MDKIYKNMKNLREGYRSTWFAAISGTVLIYQLFTHKLLAETVYTHSIVGLVYLSIFFYHHFILPSHVVYIVRTIEETPPTPVYLSVLLLATEHKTARKEASAKIVAILQTMRKKDILNVERKLWKSFYKYAKDGSLEHKQAAFKIALLLKDPNASPFLKRIVRNSDLQPDSKELFDSMLHKYQRLHL
jgi:hypothetical protein